MRLIDELNQMYDLSLRQINAAVAADDVALAERLAQAYEDDAIQLMAEREGLTSMLPLTAQARPASALRRMVDRLRSRVAA